MKRESGGVGGVNSLGGGGGGGGGGGCSVLALPPATPRQPEWSLEPRPANGSAATSQRLAVASRFSRTVKGAARIYSEQRTWTLGSGTYPPPLEASGAGQRGRCQHFDEYFSISRPPIVSTGLCVAGQSVKSGGGGGMAARRLPQAIIGVPASRRGHRLC